MFFKASETPLMSEKTMFLCVEKVTPTWTNK